MPRLGLSGEMGRDATVGRFGSCAEAEMTRQLIDDAGIAAHVRDGHRDEAHGFLAQVTAAPEDRGVPDRARRGIRNKTAGVLVATFGIGLLVQLAMPVLRWL